MSNIYGGYDSDDHQQHISNAGGTQSASDSLKTKADVTAVNKPTIASSFQSMRRISNDAETIGQEGNRGVIADNSSDQSKRSEGVQYAVDNIHKAQNRVIANRDTLNQIAKGKVIDSDATPTKGNIINLKKKGT
jgi:hypothetical protein